MRRSAALTLLLLALAGCEPAPRSDLPPFQLRTTLAIPELGDGTRRYPAHVGYIDADSALDVIIRIDDAGEWAVSFAIFEVDADSLALRTWIRDTENARDVWVADVDGDGVTEVAHGNHHGAFKVLEPTKDGSYAPRWSANVGRYLDYLVVGDTDGDGRREYLLAMEASPAQLLIVEATGPDTYQLEATILGADEGYAEPSPPLLPDLDGDGQTELVFGRKTFRDAYVYRDRVLSLTYDGAAIHGMGDTDGDGRDELMGLRGDRLLVLEYDLEGDSLRVVFEQPAQGFVAGTVDIDRDGVGEFVQRGPGWFRLAHLEGDELVVIFDSGPLTPGSEAEVNRVVPIPDTDGDGRAEFLVSQPPYLHIFEATPDR